MWSTRRGRRAAARGSAAHGSAAHGFSLLEMLVAISILGLALGALYQAAGGATRNVRIDEKYAYGVELARSLLAANAQVPLEGVSSQGETAGGYAWRVATRPLSLERTALAAVRLYDIQVGVSWIDGSKRREVVLDSVVEGFKPAPGRRGRAGS